MTNEIMRPSYVDSILNLLYAGEHVRVKFHSAEARENFRKRLYARKAQQDELLSAVIGEPHKVLKCELGVIPGIYYGKFWLAPTQIRLFDFEILRSEAPQQDDADEHDEQGEKISSNMDKTS